METTHQPPARAFRLTLKMDADTRPALVSALIDLATQIDREEITTGISGGWDSGSIYELLIDESQTHENYFLLLNQYLEKKKKFIDPVIRGDHESE